MSNRAGSILVDAPVIQTGEGGSIPTPALRKADWRVIPVSLDLARDMTRRHHYSGGGSNTAVAVHGMVPAGSFFEAEAVAVAWWLPPTKAAGAKVWPDDPQAVLALSRLVAGPNAPKNSCSFLLRHAMRQLDRRRWPLLVTFADPWQSHTGAIYRAAGWIEAGQGKPEAVYVRNGRMMSRKRGPRTYRHDEMLAMGFECKGKFARLRFVHVRKDLEADWRQRVLPMLLEGTT